MNILVTGANGFLGSSIINLLSNHGDFVFFKGTRDTINLYSYNSIEEYIDHNKIEAVIHCAIAGGSRLKRDGVDEFYQNLLMYENLIKFNFGGIYYAGCITSRSIAYRRNHSDR